MKKLLLSLVAVLFFGVTFAQESYTIKFTTASSDGTAAITTNTKIADVVSEGASYISAIKATNNCYNKGIKGLKFSSSSKNGAVTFTMSETGAVDVDKIVVNACKWKSSEAAKLAVNGLAAQDLTNDLADYTFAVTGKLNELTLTATKRIYVASVTVYYTVQAGAKLPTGLSYPVSAVEVSTNALDKFEAPVLSNPNNLAVTYASSDENVAEVSTEGVVTLTGDEGVAVIKAEFKGDDTYNAGSASYTITVKNVPVNESSEANPYTAAQALALANSLDASTQVPDVYAKGYVIAIKELSTSFGNATYTIADAADATEGLSVFRGYYLNGDKFTAEDQLKVGAEVVVCGTIVNFKGNTPQFTTGSKLVSYKYEGGDTPEPETPSIANLKEAFALATGTKVVVDCPLTVGFVNKKNIFVCDADGDFIQIYAENTYKVGDVLAAGWEATYTVRFDVPQFAPVAALPAATEGTFTPKTVAAADVTKDIVNHVIVVKDVVLEEASPATAANFTGKVGDVTLNLRNNYSLASVEAGTYDITLWVNLYQGDLSLYVINYEKSQSSGIEDVAVDEAEAVYYNLQGVRVDNPANGVYIRVAGSDVSKVYVR